MADQQNNQPESRYRGLGRLFGIPENVIDAGILAIVGTIWYKISGGRGNFMPNIGGNNPPVAEAIAPTQADEGNFDTLLTVFEEGGVNGCICADQISEVHAAFLSIHQDHAKLFRNFFFSMSGVKVEETFKKLQELLEKLCMEDNDDTKWVILSKSPSFPIKRALKLCKEIEQEVKKFHPHHMSYDEASKHAYLIIARRMIDDKRLQGTLVTHAEEGWTHGVEHINTKLQEWNRKQEIKKEDQTKKSSPWKWMGVLWISIIILMIIVSISAPPEPKPTTPPIGLSDKVSQQATGWIESLKTHEEN